MNTIYTVCKRAKGAEGAEEAEGAEGAEIFFNRKGVKTPQEGPLKKINLVLTIGSKVAFSADGYRRIHNNKKMLYVVFLWGVIHNPKTNKNVNLNEDKQVFWISEDRLCAINTQS